LRRFSPSLSSCEFYVSRILVDLFFIVLLLRKAITNNSHCFDSVALIAGRRNLSRHIAG